MNWVKEYFSFTKKERIGIITLILLIAFIWFLPDIVKNPTNSKPIMDTAWMSAAKKLEKPEHAKQEFDNRETARQDNSEGAYSGITKTLFYFDPNTLPHSGWVKLGLAEKTINTIRNYISKGGRFKKPEDLLRIYGMKKIDAEKLIPYIRIISTGEKNRDHSTEKVIRKFDSLLVYKKSIRIIDINSADTSDLISLPGIGAKLATRIVNFREKLGGFHKVDQVKEIYNLPDSVFQRIKPYLDLGQIEIKKFNINTATKDQLKAHPYIQWNLATAIVAYRNQHGNYSSLEDLKKIDLITEEIFGRLAPYLTL